MGRVAAGRASGGRTVPADCRSSGSMRGAHVPETFESGMLTIYNAWRRLDPTLITFRHCRVPKPDGTHDDASTPSLLFPRFGADGVLEGETTLRNDSNT